MNKDFQPNTLNLTPDTRNLTPFPNSSLTGEHMKRTLICIMAVALTTWSLRAGINPHIVEVDLNIEGVDGARWGSRSK